MRFKMLAIVLCLVVLLAGCASKNGGYSGSIDGIEFSLSDLGAEVSIHTPSQAQLVQEVREDPAANSFMSYARGVQEQSRPLPVTLMWSAKGETAPESYTVTLSRQADMQEAVYTATTQDTVLDVYNLEIGATYYWTVTAHAGEKSVTSGVAIFTTADQAPRNLYVGGVTNVRDLGGWKTEDGGRVRQGLIYRCGRLNQSSAQEMLRDITSDGVAVMLDQLGIRAEVDLRTYQEASKIKESPLGSNVTYRRFDVSYNSDSELITGNGRYLREQFAFLADESNYPMIIHCNIGTDRTGMISFLINALLGVSQEDLCADYCFSNLGNIGDSRDAQTILDGHLAAVNSAKGDTLSQRTYNYLLEAGVSADDLDAVIRIMKEAR